MYVYMYTMNYTAMDYSMHATVSSCVVAHTWTILNHRLWKGWGEGGPHKGERNGACIMLNANYNVL